MKSWLLAVLAGLVIQSPYPDQTEWTLSGPPKMYAMEASGRATVAAGAAITLRSVVPAPVGIARAMGSIDAGSLRGHRVIVTGEVQTHDVNGSASLWVEMDEGPNHAAAGQRHGECATWNSGLAPADGVASGASGDHSD